MSEFQRKGLTVFFLCLFCIEGFAKGDNGCLRKEYGVGKIVCVCNSEHCDYLFPELTPDKINVITSTKNGDRYSTEIKDFDDNPTSSNIIKVNKELKYQKILGWGGALTDATAINYESLPPKAGDHLMRSYFTGMGSMYNLCRVPMGGTDFSTHGYSYDDGQEDGELNNFKLAPEDFKYKLPLMRMVRNFSMYQTQLKFFTSTWTAPKWMTTNGQYTGGTIKPEWYQTWANYFLKFLKAYKDEGFDFWGLSTGNEPFLAKLPVKINSVSWNSKTASLWVREHLGPTLRNSEFKNVKIMAIDDQRLFYPRYASNLMKNETTRNYIDGFAVHWYTDGVISPKVLSQIHEKFPDKFILSTEASEGFLPHTKHVDIASWERGEKYAKDIIDDLNNWVTGWVDWNLALDLTGGPTYIDNFVDAAILVNKTSGEFYKQPMYYAIGHFSKFIPERSVRIDVSSSSNLKGLYIVALQRPDPDYKTVIVLLNRNEKDLTISIQDKKFINLKVEANSIKTIIY